VNNRTEITPSAFGALVRAERESQGITQTTLAEKSAVPQPNLARIEKGTANPTLRTMGRIAAALGYRLVLRLDKLKEKGA
jgi:transcriptional regulator with XRE-family HTH domain